MEIRVEWARPVQLTKPRAAMGYTFDLEGIPQRPGIYVFGRKWGGGFEALYVGKSKELRGRIRDHLNNLKLMNHLARAKEGKRVLVYGIVVPKGGQNIAACLTIVEKTLIRYYLSEGDDLVNQQGTALRQHEVLSRTIPLGIVPRRMFVDRR